MDESYIANLFENIGKKIKNKYFIFFYKELQVSKKEKNQ